MRYIIRHRARHGGQTSALVSTFAAVIADDQESACALFAEKYPDREILSFDQGPDDQKEALRLYGEGGWTEEEQAAQRAALQATYDRQDRERENARRAVMEMDPAEFLAEAEYQARRAAETTPNVEGVHVGDVFEVSWGYDQTNWDFYQVVALKGKHTAVVRRMACKCEEYDCMIGFTRPVRDQFINSDEHTVRTYISEYRKSYHRETVPAARVPDLSGKKEMLLRTRSEAQTYTAYA